MSNTIDIMTKFTIEEFQSDFDNLMNKVSNGESFIISSEYGEAMITQYDDIMRIHIDHHDAC